MVNLQAYDDDGAEQNQAPHSNVADPLGMGTNRGIILVLRHLNVGLSAGRASLPHLAPILTFKFT